MARRKKQSEKVAAKVAAEWNEYFGAGDLSAWQRLMADLGIPGTFTSKTQCKKALRNVWVNIVDFLHNVREGRQTRHFKTQNELSNYTRDTGKIYPRRMVTQDSPLKGLLAFIF
ncbi:hypothetical protein F5B19DRAFT_496294 [Rostrohypoxylon terebratum]|nr:hypothetical protein F5B19DRAFT_496294 [Rostrohypoxylon terebratum]